MKLKDFLLFIPRGAIATFTKIYREDIGSELLEYIKQENLYHVVPNEEIAGKIIESEKVKASKSRINSYGSRVCCMFAGMPELDNYIKNLVYSTSDNILLHPEKIVHAVKFPIQEEYNKFKVRSLADNVILHEGDCQIPKEKIEVKQLVLDLIKDENGKEILGFRERTKEEILENGDKYIPSEKCLQEVEKQKEQNGYYKKDFLGIGNTVNGVIHQQKLEEDYYKKGIGNFFKRAIGKIKSIFGKNEIKALPEVTSHKEEVRKFKKTLENKVEPLDINKIMEEQQVTRQMTRE